MQELAAVPIDGTTLGQAIAESGASKTIKPWLESQPVKAVEFDDNLSVRLTLATPAEQLWPVLRSAIERQKQIPPPSTQAQWDQLFAVVTAHLTRSQGIGVVQPRCSPPPPRQLSSLPKPRHGPSRSSKPKIPLPMKGSGSGHRAAPKPLPWKNSAIRSMGCHFPGE